MTVVWEAPPRRVRGHIDEQLRELDARPDVWARLREAGTQASAASQAAKLRIRFPGYEFCSRTSGGRYYVYGRRLRVEQERSSL